MQRRRLLVPALLGLSLATCAAPVEGDPDAEDSAGEQVAAADRIDAVYAAAGKLGQDFVMDRVKVLADDSFEGRGNLTEGGKAARLWLKADLENAGFTVSEHAFDKGVNLCTTIPGADLAAEHVVIGAHYDHLGVVGAPGSQCKAIAKGKPGAKDTICNGAIDNAAGVAAAILVARAVKDAAHRCRRSVTVCLFDAEEDGLLGSYHMTKNAAPIATKDVAAMMTIDNVGSRIFPKHDSSFATDAEYSAALREHVLAANKRTGYQTWPVSSFFVGQEGGGRSDHLPFRKAGVPVLFLGSGSSSVYHTPIDDLAALDGAKLLKIAHHAALLTAMIANADARPDFDATPEPHLDDARAMVSLADKVLEDPKALNLNEAQVDLVKGWRADLQKWLDTPPTTAAQWKDYQTLVKAIITAVYLVTGG